MSWQSREIRECIKYFREQRQCRKKDIIKIEDIPDNTSKKDKIAYIKEHLPNPETNFVAIIYEKRDLLYDDMFRSLGYKYYTKVFFYDELLVCPMDNILVPVHRLCTQDEIQAIGNNISRLPKISISDPIIRWSGWDIGDVIAIERKNSGIYYRIIDLF